MDAEDVFTLCQNELPFTSFLAFDDMREKGELCDLTIELQNRSITVHSVVLAAGIPYFRKMFTKSAAEKEEMKTALEDLDPRALESLILFAYSSKVKISVENAQSLLVTSQFLQLEQVSNVCVEFLSERLRVENVAQIHTFACKLQNINLIESSDCYIRNNFTQFSKSPDFLRLSLSCIKGIISEDELNVPSEEIVFESVMKWVKNMPSERHVVLPELLREVRLCNLPVRYLIEQVESEELIKNSKPCRDIINKIKNYHLLSETSTVCLNLKTRPRNCIKPKLYVVCSSVTSGYSLHCFDSSAQRLNKLACLNFPNESVNTVVAVNGKIYIFFISLILKFCLKTHELLQGVCDCNSGAVVVPYGNLIYCFGGLANCFKKKVRRFDTVLDEWLADGLMKSPRGYAGACVLSGSIYVCGGYNNRSLDTVEKYNPVTGSWSDVAPMLTPRDQHGCASIRGRMYACGGYTTSGEIVHTAELYDPQIDQWRFITSMKNKVHMFPCVSHNNKIYAFVRSAVEIYDPNSDEWKSDFMVYGDVHGAVSIAGNFN